MQKSITFPEVHLDRSAEAQTLRKQIEKQLVSAIRSGTLPCNARLPSSRLMAKLLHVSRGTVIDAYEALLETGILTARAGRGITVTPSLPSVPNFSNLKRTAIPAHFLAHVYQFEDWDGTPLYLNLLR